MILKKLLTYHNVTNMNIAHVIRALRSLLHM